MPLTVRCRSGSRLPPGSAGRCPATGRGWLLLGKSAAEQFQPLRGSLRLHHQRLVDGAHAHPPRHVVAQAFVGGGGGRGHGAMVAVAGGSGQVRLWAARQAGAPAGILSVMGAWRLQPTRLRVWLCRPSPLHLQNQWAGHGNTWASSSGGTDKSIRSNPCPLALPSRPPRRSPSVMPLSACTMIMWIDNVYLKGLGLLNACC